MKKTVYNPDGESQEAINLPPALFDQPLRPDLLHRAVMAARHNARTPVAHTKDRRDRRGGGTKPWRQKGTGRARHGSIRSPLWRKGGVTFGPRNSRNLKKKVNKKEKRAALVSALSAKATDGEVLLVNDLRFEEPKAAQARQLLDDLSTVKGFSELQDRRNNAALLVVPEVEDATRLSFRNFGNVSVRSASDLNALDLLTYKFAIIVDPEEVFTILTERIEVKQVA